MPNHDIPEMPDMPKPPSVRARLLADYNRGLITEAELRARIPELPPEERDETVDCEPRPPGYIFPDFRSLAKHLVALHPPKDADTAMKLDFIREEFDGLIGAVATVIPEGKDAEIAAHAIHDACQKCIAAVVLNQGE